MLSEMLGMAARAAELARQVPGVKETAELARQVPGVREAEQAVEGLERRAIQEVRELLDALESDDPAMPVLEGQGRTELASGFDAVARAPRRASSQPATGWADSAAESGAAPRPWAAQMLSELLDRSVEQTKTEARRALYERVLRQLVPDEARILAALSDGSAYPVIDVVLRNAVGGVRRRLVENVSSVGREAGVALPGQVHWYVTHLRNLGLVDIGPEDPALADRYEILATEEVVRRAEDSRAGRGAAVKTVRGTVRLSALGWELWRECNPPA